jgi:hypothetical protein
VRFAWNREKAATNLAKHGVTFAEAASVFEDPLAATYADPFHSRGEERFLTLGHSRLGRLLVVAHTELENETIRIVSARRATARERHAYTEEG